MLAVFMQHLNNEPPAPPQLRRSGLHVSLFFLLSPFGAKMRKASILRNFSSHSYSIYIVHHPIFSYVGVMPSKVDHSLGSFAILAILLLPLPPWLRQSSTGLPH